MNNQSLALVILTIKGSKEDAIEALSSRNIVGFLCNDNPEGATSVKAYFTKELVEGVVGWLCDLQTIAGAEIPKGSLLAYKIFDDHVHGCAVIKRQYSRYYDADVILVENFKIGEFVCAVHKPGMDEWHWGNYFNSYQQALNNFTERCAK